jgi:hypothetical protein
MRSFNKFWKYVRRIKRDFPLSHPVSIRTHKSIKWRDGTVIFGDCCFRNGRFHIRVARAKDESVMVDTLFHEVAHALVWDREQGHKRRFWDQYGAIYRFYLD